MTFHERIVICLVLISYFLAILAELVKLAPIKTNPIVHHWETPGKDYSWPSDSTTHKVNHVPVYYYRVNFSLPTSLEENNISTATSSEVVNQWKPPSDASSGSEANSRANSSDKWMQMFRCPISNELISIDQVCDGVSNCADGADEAESCEHHFRRNRMLPGRTVNLFYLTIGMTALFATVLCCILFSYFLFVRTTRGNRFQKEQSMQLSSIQCNDNVSSPSEINNCTDAASEVVNEVAPQLSLSGPVIDKDSKNKTEADSCDNVANDPESAMAIECSSGKVQEETPCEVICNEKDDMNQKSAQSEISNGSIDSKNVIQPSEASRSDRTQQSAIEISQMDCVISETNQMGNMASTDGIFDCPLIASTPKAKSTISIDANEASSQKSVKQNRTDLSTANTSLTSLNSGLSDANNSIRENNQLLEGINFDAILENSEDSENIEILLEPITIVRPINFVYRLVSNCEN